MSIAMSIALYFIVWWLTLFVVMPFGLRTQGESGEVVPGTPASAPSQPQLIRMFATNTVVATLVFGTLYLALTQGWVSAEMFEFGSVRTVKTN